MRHRAAVTVALLAAGAVRMLAQADVLERIRDEAGTRSRALAYFSTLTDQFGPRLTGTPAYKQAADWARERMAEVEAIPRPAPAASGR